MSGWDITKRLVALAGGVGGARLAAGLQAAVGGDRLSVIVNTADDFEHLGLSISPDLDTVTYTLAGVENAAQGWGRRDETWAFMSALEALGGETWFQLGDRDLATHVERSRRLAAGDTLSRITAGFNRALGVRASVIPMSDNPVRTVIDSDQGRLAFQDYFVRLRCAPRLLGVGFEGSATARAAPDALAALGDPDLGAIVLCPSNPYVSVAPLLSIFELRSAIERRRVPLVAVSPIVGGKAIKGPAAKMMGELGVDVSVLGIAQHYRGLIDGLVIDTADAAHRPVIEALGMAVHVTDSIMRDDASRRQLAAATLDFAADLQRARAPVGDVVSATGMPPIEKADR